MRGPHAEVRGEFWSWCTWLGLGLVLGLGLGLRFGLGLRLGLGVGSRTLPQPHGGILIVAHPVELARLVSQHL